MSQDEIFPILKNKARMSIHVPKQILLVIVKAKKHKLNTKNGKHIQKSKSNA